ncbi:MAG: hypothetical protein M3Y72_25040 [Acidobacteriota bacterium]|nr:hypothetical protein [Acidobacteriota bacterium]
MASIEIGNPLEIAVIAWGWLQKVLTYSIPSAGLVFLLFKWAGNTWVGRLLNRDLEKFKREQQEKLESVKSEQQKEIERLRHLLSSRVSRIHEKEFKVLPKAWRMLNELRGSVAHAVDVTIKYYSDFDQFSESKLEAFLQDEAAAQRLSDYQISELRNIDSAKDQRKYYMDAMMARNINEAEEKRRLFVNYLIQNRIFLNDELRSTFANVQGVLISALTSYSVGKNAEDWKMVSEGQKAIIDTKMQDLIDEVDRAIQKRLRYAEAD